MAGLLVFRSLAEAIRNGFTVYDRTSDGYLVRKHSEAGWMIALVALK